MSQLRWFDMSIDLATAAGATISACGRYRYDLHRCWRLDCGKGLVNFILLNPSIGDHLLDDPTIRRCRGFAQSWGYGSLVITNLYGFRATDPDALALADDPIGEENDIYLGARANEADLVVFGWGTHPMARRRAGDVESLVLDAGKVPHVLRLTKGGHPAHPLYLPANLDPVPMAG